MDDRRRSYCCHWSLFELRCKLGRPCGLSTPYSCPDYGDVLDSHSPVPAPLEPKDRPPEVASASARPVRPVPCPECGQALFFRDGCAVCAGGHSWKLRRGRQHCPHCGETYSTFGIPMPGHELIYRNVYQLCSCGWIRLQVRYVGPAEGRGYRGQRWSPRTGRLLVRKEVNC